MSEISATIEETNALRAKLGLKPLKLGPETSKAKTAEDNLKKQREEEAHKAHEDAIKSRIAKARNRRELNKTVAGKGLGEASDDEGADDIFKWTMKSRQKEKERAARREKELQELDEIYQQEEYDEDQLAGLRVGHDLSDFQEGEERILTLKDSTILENEEHGDELINIQMAEHDRLHKNIENKKKAGRPVYTGYDDDEFVSGNKKNLLSQYDEVLGIEAGAEGFVLGKANRSRRDAAGQDGSSTGKSSGLSAKEIMNQKLKESAIALTYNKTQQSQDYYTKEEAEVTFKKPKKKKKSRRKTDNWEEDENQDESAMEVERPEPVDISDMNFVDDEDLQASLSKARRVATKKAIKTLTPEQIAKNLAESAAMEMEEDEALTGGLVISDVSEFVSNLSSSAVQIPSGRPAQVSRSRQKSSEPEDNHVKEDSEMTDAQREDTADDVEPNVRAKSEESEDNEQPSKETKDEEQSTSESVLIDEPLVSRGLGSTLALLKQKGAYEMGSAEQAERAKTQNERAKWLADSRLREAKLARELARDKARDKERSKDKNYSSRDRERDREYENQRREQMLLDEREARMKNYKPDIKLEYIDESGNRLNTKEAFRQLSHAFHGKTSGKMKTEKRMKKLDDEKRLLGMSSTDTPLNMVSAFQERQKAAGSAHIVLAVGNRKYVSDFVTLHCSIVFLSCNGL
ncbi:SART-1 protein [Mortierella sp. GBAus27b]|nr:SART-1 protein [Mortierella sp. GBAus27b]